MDYQQLVSKLHSGEITEAEEKELVSKIQEEMDAIKQKDPQKYLKLLEQLNEVIETINSKLAEV